MLYFGHSLAAERRIPFHLLGFLSLLALSGARNLPGPPASASTQPFSSKPAGVAVVRPQPAPVTPHPRACLAGELPHIASRKLSTEQRYRYYAAIAEGCGGHVEPQKVSVLGLRGINPRSRRHVSSENAGPYDDTFVILQHGPRGQPEVTELCGSTHAGQESSTLAPNGVAQVRPGHFHAVPEGEHNGMACWLVLTSDRDEHLPCWRDVDQDGVISAREKVRGKTADGILFHNGRFADHGSSIGCQTMPPDIYQRFIDRIGPSSSFEYTLVDANRPIPANPRVS